MPIDYSKLSGGASADTVTDPQKLFQALPAKDKRFRYLRDVQGDVLASWYTSRTTRDRVIKMNTGGGKTPVGLLILKSCLNEGVSPAVYVAPDNFLCSQVEKEAADLGIATTSNPRSGDYQSGKAILVINIHTLINGMSKFGVGAEGSKLDIGSIVIDDAHACLAVAESQFTLTLPREHDAYEKLFRLFQSDMRTQSTSAVAEIARGDPKPLVRVPYWAWINKQDEVVDILVEYRDDDELMFVWPLLKDDLALCQCLFTSTRVEVSSRCLPITAIPSFARARRRIYMTATLADDGVLVTDFDADPEAVKSPVTPKTASDLGERMILVPQSINPQITDEAIREFVASFAVDHNVVVIVPSNLRADFWSDVASLTLTAENIHEGVEKLRSSIGQLAVMVNKYDGVDLPDDACRILVIDGVPDARRLIDRREQAILGASDRYRSRQVQRVEQGMGRGIRSNDDYCVVLLMGAQLLSALYGANATRFLSPATASQLALSQEVAAQISRRGLESIKGTMADVLNRNPQWIKAARNALIDITYPQTVTLDVIGVAQRSAFEASRRGQYDKAEKALRSAMSSDQDRYLDGWLLEQIAEAVHPLDAVRSQEILSGAHDRNGAVTKPMKGIAYKRMDTAGLNQARQASLYLKEKYDGGNALVLGLNGLLDRLMFQADTAEPFEQSLMELGLHLGFRAQRPEKETGVAGLDVLWGIGDREYLLLACKNGAETNSVSKHYSDEISGSVNWFCGTYDHTCSAIPVIVHRAQTLDQAAAPPPNLRILTETKLEALKKAAAAFGLAVKDRVDEVTQVREALRVNGLLGTQFVAGFTVEPRYQRKSSK